MVKNKPLFFISFILAILTIPLGMKIWPPAVGGPILSSTQLSLFIGVSLFEALGFGIGIYFLVSGWKLVKSNTSSLDFWTYLAIIWSLMSWWPHDRLHAHIGEDVSRLLMLEYGFHITLIIGGIIIAKFFYKTLQFKHS